MCEGVLIPSCVAFSSFFDVFGNLYRDKMNDPHNAGHSI